MNKKGNRTRTDPIRTIREINRVKHYLVNDKRNYAIFVTGINTNLRASDLIGLTVGRVKNLTPGEVLVNKDEKVDRYVLRSVSLNVVNAIQDYLKVHPNPVPESPLFVSQRGGGLIVPTLCRLVKGWCDDAGLEGQYSSHTLRKTWAYHAVKTFKRPIELVSAALGHTTTKVTLAYLGIQDEDIKAVFMDDL